MNKPHDNDHANEKKRKQNGKEEAGKAGKGEKQGRKGGAVLGEMNDEPRKAD